MLQTWTCTICGKKFTVGEWTCADGQSNHVVAEKEYLLNDAPTDASVRGTSLGAGRTRICNIPPDKSVVANGEVQRVPGGYVEFIRGRFSSTNPEVQYYLERKGGFCTQEQWQRAWLSDGQQLEIEKMNLAAERSRLENDRNELLAQVKAAKSARV